MTGSGGDDGRGVSSVVGAALPSVELDSTSSSSARKLQRGVPGKAIVDG